MTMTLEIPNDLGQQIEQAARLHGTDSETFVIEAARAAADQSEADRQAAIKRLRGRSKGVGPTVNDFLIERSEEGRKEAGL